MKHTIWLSRSLFSLAIFGCLFPLTAKAQVKADGTTSTQVNQNGNDFTIEQGDRVGDNLFHSFEQFSVPTMGEAAFNNAGDIANIFSRVTGSNISNIDGLIRANGTANLFLINPNGIIFGENASLNLGGSFFASTADSLLFDGNAEFSASNPQAPPLLEVDIPIGINFRSNHSGVITNKGNLAVEQDLTLEAGNLDLQGQLKAGQDLTLKAQDTVLLRDNATQPFLAEAGGELLLQGERAIDLSGLNNIDSKLFSSRDLIFRSPTRLFSSNAVYTTGGIFRTEQLDGTVVDFFIPHERVIKANGDVSLEAYEGQSLYILAGGSVTFEGDVTITDSQQASVPKDFTTANGTSILVQSSNQTTLDVRAGIDWQQLPGELPGNIAPDNLTATFANSATNGDITAGEFDNQGDFVGNQITNKGGVVLLTNQYQPNTALPRGAIQVGSIDTSGSIDPITEDVGDGGAIILHADGDLTTSSLNSSSTSISFSSPESGSSSGNTGNGGAITLHAGGDLTTSSLNSSSSSFSTSFSSSSASGNTGNGGAITLYAGGDLTTSSLNSSSSSSSFSFSSSSSSGSTGNGGTITLHVGGDLTASSLRSFSSSSSISGSESGSSASGNTGNGGAITLYAGGDLTANSLDSSSESASSASGNTGNGGAITLYAGGDLTANSLDSSSFSSRGNGGNGGAITLHAGGDLTTNSLDSYSFSSRGNGGNGGAITLHAGSDISIGELSPLDLGQISSFSYSDVGDAGDAGKITIFAKDGSIRGENKPSIIESFSVSNTGNTGTGGNVFLEAKNNITNLEILTLSSDDESGIVQIKGFGDLLITDTNILTSKQLAIQVKRSREPTRLFVGGRGTSGDVEITSNGNLTFNNSSIESDTKGSDPAGDVNITSQGLITFNDTDIITNTSNIGQAGSIIIEATEGLMLDSSSSISAITNTTTTNAGNAGNITVDSPNFVDLGANSELIVETSSSGRAGNINITTNTLNIGKDAKLSATATEEATNTQEGGSITLNTQNLNVSGELGIFAETEGEAPAGNLTINPDNNNPNLNIRFTDDGFISARTTASGQGGNINISAPNAINISGQGSITTETSGSGNAGVIEIDSQQLALSDGLEISASTSRSGTGGSIIVNAPQSFSLQQSSLLTQASSTGAAGNVTINTPKLTLLEGSKVSASTQRSLGGSIQLQGLNTLEVSNSEISTSTETGAAGNLTVNAGEMTITDGGAVTVSSPQGQAGNLRIAADSLFLNRGSITAETGKSGTEGGANINLEISDIWRIENESLVSATASGFADGGNININNNLPNTELFLVAFPPTGYKGSDIIANAEDGNGGRIDITAAGIFGIEFREDLSPLNDFTVTSEFGQSGETILNRTIDDPTSGLIELPQAVGDPSDQISQNPCQQGVGSEFIITGKGGLPPNPKETLNSDAVRVDLVEPVLTESIEAEEQESREVGANGIRPAQEAVQEEVPAQGWIINEKGEVTLTAYATTGTKVERSWQSSASCPSEF